MSQRIGYCLNIHPGTTLEAVKNNLQTHSLQVKETFSPDSPLNVGLWLSDTVSRELSSGESAKAFSEWLSQRHLNPFTFNGFPFDNFHQDVVKHAVYLPTWADERRRDYTIRLGEIFTELLPENGSATISTLPLSWPVSNQLDSFLDACVLNLRTTAEVLSRFYDETGKLILICIEPEPGCTFDRAEHVVAFFRKHLLTGQSSTDDTILRHIGVCHDVCHSSVMFESQETAIRSYADAGIKVGKVQVSSAVEVDFRDCSKEEQDQKATELGRFAEPRYLHQTSIRDDDGEVRFFEDLPGALESQEKQGLWRVHFHVPVYVSSFERLGTTQADIARLVDAVRKHQPEMTEWEVETYAWNVMPHELQGESVSQSIAAELTWFSELLENA